MSMAEKKKDGLIAWENLIIAGGGLLDVGNKINEAKKSSFSLIFRHKISKKQGFQNRLSLFGQPALAELISKKTADKKT